MLSFCIKCRSSSQPNPVGCRPPVPLDLHPVRVTGHREEYIDFDRTAPRTEVHLYVYEEGRNKYRRVP